MTYHHLEPPDERTAEGPRPTLGTGTGAPPPPSWRPAMPSWLGNVNRQLQFLFDLLILVGAFLSAYLLRFEFALPQSQLEHVLVQLPTVVLIQILAIQLTGIYSFVWRYIGMAEVKAFLEAALYSALPILLLRLGLPEAWQSFRVPLSVIVIDTLLAFGGLLALRVLRRALYERSRSRPKEAPASPRRPVLLVGAGQSGVTTVREIKGRSDMDLAILGFVDDDPAKQGMVIQGVKVLGTSRDIPRLVAEHSVDHVVITIVEASRSEIRRIVDICERVPVRVRIVPGLFEILQGKVSISRIRDVQIEDLLGRDPVHLDSGALEALIRGRRVLVTGAGGSIGSELARQVARLEPERLLLVERAENALFEITRELHGRFDGQLPEGVLASWIGDVGDRARMETLLRAERPHLVLHAAAHKHVPLMEDNPGEAIKNNVLATRALGELAGATGVEAFVLVSTDKAVRPTSVMGASKRLAELVIQSLDQRFPSTHFVAVRFGNVLGSTGSVIPIFRQQIARGGPVTVTHPSVTRYFMTIPEAAQLVLEAGTLGEGGEIFILDMGDPVRILDLAEDMITLSGFKPYEEIDIEFTGLRPGEKLFEELELMGEDIKKTRNPKIYIGRLEPRPEPWIDHALARLEALAEDGADQPLRQLLAELLPEARLGGGQFTPPAVPIVGAGDGAG